MKTLFKNILFGFIFILFFTFTTCASNKSSTLTVDTSSLSFEKIYTSTGGFYTFYYKDIKPDDVPQEIYDRLWKIQKEVIDNLTYDDDAFQKRYIPVMTTKQDYYKYGKGVCDNYATFFYILAFENGLTENLHYVGGDKEKGVPGHAWLEYRTKKNIYIIDPTWSDDNAISDDVARKAFIKSRVYGRIAFFTTYAENNIIFSLNHRLDAYSRSSYTIDFQEIFFINDEKAWVVKNRLVNEINKIANELNEMIRRGESESREYKELGKRYYALSGEIKKIRTEEKLKVRK